MSTRARAICRCTLIAERLTLNLGLRYELTSPIFDTQDRMTTRPHGSPTTGKEVPQADAGEPAVEGEDAAVLRRADDVGLDPGPGPL